MPDSTNLVHIREQHAQEREAAARKAAVEHALMVLDVVYRTERREMHYLTVVSRLRDVLNEEIAMLTAPDFPPELS